MYSRLRIVLGNNTLASYPHGGGHWSVFIQYLLGLQDLGHNIFWLEILTSTENESQDRFLIKSFFRRMKKYGFLDRCALLLTEKTAIELNLETAESYGMDKHRIKEIVTSADLLWNFGCSLRQPLLSLFNRRALIDLDPGHLQISALTWDMEIHDHDVFITVGGKINDDECQVPTHGVSWKHCTPFVFLPMWSITPDPGEHAPFSSVTQWTWEELWMDSRVLSISKRDAYLNYLELPEYSNRNFELAANIHPRDRTGDRELLRSHGWRLVHPHTVAKSPSSYRKYIIRSRAEISCPKPIHKDLKTGWFSDRSACYLATGRPVLAEDTGFSEYLPTGKGLVAFTNMEEAISYVKQIDSNYPLHMREARRLSEEFFDSRQCLEKMISTCI